MKYHRGENFKKRLLIRLLVEVKTWRRLIERSEKSENCVKVVWELFMRFTLRFPTKQTMKVGIHFSIFPLYTI